MTLPPAVVRDAELLWAFHRLDDELRPVDVAIGLGSHDPGVPVYAAELYRAGLFPRIVFTGANAPTTVARFPRGEAVHYREIALAHGVADHAILIETRARNTAENLDFVRALLAARNLVPASAVILCRPYQQRRAYATVRRRWPELDVLCSAAPRSFAHYAEELGDPHRVVHMLVGDTQRLTVYARTGDAIAQTVPEPVQRAYERLVDRGFTARLLR